ncbi:hypothetical protein NQ318_010222 [Aromia moschata]|uniref:DDE-1 domain-containing protein n=1 Tax=Aromia moschata TaxID=1265417 RepID=A0AAV8X7M7_9CUCU|nr:hypothetical protein NQ318_010222 [Aromia moschata]
MDESGIMTTTNKPPKVLSISGKKQVGIISSAERGQLTTVICCCNATGSFIPPFMIFARKRMQERLLDGAPPGTQATCTPNGGTNGETFLLWLKMFVEYVRLSETKRVVLLLDNHESHKYYPALVEFASQNHVTFVSFPPHTTHKVQPLDVVVYGPVKKKQHPGRIVGQYDVARLFREAYLKGANPNGVSGFAFRVSGLLTQTYLVTRISLDLMPLMLGDQKMHHYPRKWVSKQILPNYQLQDLFQLLPHKWLL